METPFAHVTLLLGDREGWRVLVLIGDRRLMMGDVEAGRLSHLIDGDYSRENLVAICEAAVVSVGNWSNRDSPAAHEKLGLAWVMLKAGCDFSIHPPRPGESGCHTDHRTIWLCISWPTFSTFEYGEGYEESETFYLPTPRRLRETEGRDWY